MGGMIELSESQAWGIVLACVMMLADVIAGFLAAVINNDVSSTKMRQGLLHKVLVLILVCVCLAVEIALKHAVKLPYDIPTCEVVCGYVVVMELTSVLENIGKGYPEFRETPVYKLLDRKSDDDNGK